MLEQCRFCRFFVEFGSVYALSWNKVIDCRDCIGWVGRLCKWLTVLVDLLTGCSRRLLLHEYNVYLLICSLESMVTHSSQFLQSWHEWRHSSTSAAYFCLKIWTLRKQNISFCFMYVFGRFWTYFESYASSVIRKGTTVVLGHATSFSPSRIRNFVSYFTHDTLWAYPSVTQLKKLMLLTFHFIPHLAVDWLAQPEQLSTRIDTSILLLPLPFLYICCLSSLIAPERYSIEMTHTGGVRAQWSRGGRPGLPVPNSPYNCLRFLWVSSNTKHWGVQFQSSF